MSLILEALRKSEAERRRGLPPDLRAELPPVPARRARSGIVAATAIGAALTAFAAWFALREPATPAVAARPALRTTPSAPPPRPAQALPARTPQPQQRSGPPPVEPRPERAVASRPRTAAAPGEARSSPAETTAAAPAAATAAAPAPPPQAPSASPLPEMTPGGPDAASASEGRVLSLAELDPGTRGALPPLKLTMHLWNPDPERRLVILDGQRLGEGDRIGEARIARIERDGVLLEWHGRGIQVPVR